MSVSLPRLLGDDVFGMFDPFGLEDNLQHAVYGKHAARVMKTDIRETDKNYEFLIDLPGFKKEEVTAELKNGYLTVSASRAHEQEQKNEEGRWLRRERTFGSCSRSFYVGDGVTEADCKASFENGILTVTVPKVSALEHSGRRMIAIA